MVVLDLKSSILREVSACPRGLKKVLFHLITFLLEALEVDLSVSVVSLMSSYINVSKVILKLRITYGMNIGSHLIIRPLCFCFAILCFYWGGGGGVVESMLLGISIIY